MKINLVNKFRRKIKRAKKFLSAFGVLVLLATVSPNNSFGCSVGTNTVAKFPSEMYVFIGEVAGYTDRQNAKDINGGAAYGLKVKILETVNVPEESKDFFEIFPFGLDADCSAIGYTKKEIQDKFPINSRVRVIAAKARILPNKNKIGQTRLEAEALMSAGRNDLKDAPSVSVDSVFDYADWKQQTGILDFELLKDLKRLEKAVSENDKIKVIERLVNFPSYWLDFEAMTAIYIKDAPARESLNEKRKKFEENRNNKR